MDEILDLLRKEIIRQGGFQRMADIMGIKRQNLYTKLSSKSNPEFKSLVEIAHNLGFTFSLTLGGGSKSLPPRGQARTNGKEYT